MKRGHCKAKFEDEACSCSEFRTQENHKEGGPCLNCGHYPVQHAEVSDPNDYFSDLLKKWVIKHDQLTIGCLLGCGSFGDVYSATYCGSDFAVKVLKEDLVDTHSLNEFRKEVLALASIRHPNCINFVGATDEAPFMIVTFVFLFYLFFFLIFIYFSLFFFTSSIVQ